MNEPKRNPMTVKDLIEYLEKYPNKDEIVGCATTDYGDFIICDAEESGIALDPGDEDTFTECCMLYGYVTL